MANKTIVIIQARMHSTRLPGKMMMKLDGKPLLWHVIDKAKQARFVDEIVLATTRRKEDKVLIKQAKKQKIKCFTGSEEDVLDRFYRCAKKFKADVIIRITGDCPLIESWLIGYAAIIFKEEKVDFLSNIDPPTFPNGMEVEAFSFKILEKAWKEAKLKSERGHVDPYIMKIGKCLNFEYGMGKDFSNIRLTVDEKEDMIFLNKLTKKLKHNYSLINILKVIKKNPSLLKINNKFKRDEGYKRCLELERKG